MNHHFKTRPSGLTLVELLVATSVTAMVVGALGVFTQAVMSGWDEASKVGNTTQSGRVMLALMAHTIATSRQVIKLPDDLRNVLGMDQVLLVWERDGEASDTVPGQPNLVELVIYATNEGAASTLLEIRPNVDPALLVPLDQPAMLAEWIHRFRSGEDIVQPPVVLLSDAGGIHFELEEFPEPQGIGNVIQQNVRICLCVSPKDQRPSVFFGSATRRFVVNK